MNHTTALTSQSNAVTHTSPGEPSAACSSTVFVAEMADPLCCTDHILAEPSSELPQSHGAQRYHRSHTRFRSTPAATAGWSTGGRCGYGGVKSVWNRKVWRRHRATALHCTPLRAHHDASTSLAGLHAHATTLLECPSNTAPTAVADSEHTHTTHGSATTANLTRHTAGDTARTSGWRHSSRCGSCCCCSSRSRRSSSSTGRGSLSLP